MVGVRGQHQHADKCRAHMSTDTLAHMSLTSRHACIEGCSPQLAKHRHTYPSVDQLINLAEGLLTHSSWTIHLGQLELEQRLRLQKCFI